MMLRLDERSSKSPGTILFANDQFDRGPVMLRTDTHTSFEELYEEVKIKRA